MDASTTRDRMDLGRPLTHPTEGMKNHGWDNKNDDLIVFTGDVLEPPGCGKRYIVEDALGQGTFGQVVRCRCSESKTKVAIKIIKNQDAYFQQARVEVGILKLLGDNYSDKHNVVKILEYFVFREHLCLVFELLDANLYDLLKRNGYRGLSIQLVRYFVRQLLDALITLRDERIIHCDIKPENILLQDQTNSGRVKLIDFGSACLEHKTVYNYIQSRFYRSPEVVVGYPYNTAIDMWSLGCVAAELFLGLPLFPAASERDLLARIMEVLRPLPHHVLERAKHNTKYYRPPSDRDNPHFQFLTEKEFKNQNKIDHPSGKRYFTHTRLADIVGAYPLRQGLSEEEAKNENDLRLSFTDFLLGVLDVDPHTRWTPHQAALHPFISGEAFLGPYQPLPSPEPRGKSNPMSIAIPNPKTHGHSASWHPDVGAFSASFMNSPAHPELHAQAHRAAMAAINHISPQIRQNAVSQHIPGSLPIGYGNHVYQSSSNSFGRHGVRGSIDSIGRSIGEMRIHNQSSQMSYGQGMSPGTFGTPVFRHCSGSQMSQMSPAFSAAMAAAFGSLNRKSVGMPHAGAPPSLSGSHPNQNGIALSGLSGTSPIVGFAVPQNLPQASHHQGETIRPSNAHTQGSNHHSSIGEYFGSLPSGQSAANNDPASLSVDSLSVGGTAGEIASGARVSDAGDDDGLDCLLDPIPSVSGDGDPNHSDQDFEVGRFEDSSASYSEPCWPNSSRTGEESLRQTETCSNLGEVHQRPGSSRVPQRNYLEGDPFVSASSHYTHFNDGSWQNPMQHLPLAPTGMLTEPWAADAHQNPQLPGCSTFRSISQIPYTGMINQGGTHADAGYVKRRSQTDSFSNYLPVLQENQPMGGRDLGECPVPVNTMSRCHAHPAGGCNHTWTSVDEPRAYCNTADSRFHRFGHGGASLQTYSPISSHTRIASGGSKSIGENGIRLQTQIAASEQDIRSVVGQSVSHPRIP